VKLKEGRKGKTFDRIQNTEYRIQNTDNNFFCALCSVFCFLFFIPLLAYPKIDLFSLREKDERPIIKPEIIEEKPPIVKMGKEKPKIKPKKRIKLLPKPLKPKEIIETETIQREIRETETTQEETMPFEIFEKGQVEKERPLWLIFSLVTTSLVAIILIILIIIHLIKRERKIHRPLFHIPPSDIEEELKNLKQSSNRVSSKVSEIERMFPKELVDELRSGRIFSQIVKEVSLSLEPRIRELGLAYQGVKKSLAQLDEEIAKLSSLKGLNFKDLARQVATEFIMPLKNEFEKHRLSYEGVLSSFEQRQDGRLSTIEKRYVEVKELIDEVHKRLVGLESLVTSAAIFEQEPVIRTKKREEIPPPSKTPREEINKLIYELADSGLSVDDIAKKTKIGKGEINLILSFRNKK